MGIGHSGAEGASAVVTSSLTSHLSTACRHYCRNRITQGFPFIVRHLIGLAANIRGSNNLDCRQSVNHRVRDLPRPPVGTPIVSSDTRKH
jgi:hypothetical protein